MYLDYFKWVTYYNKTPRKGVPAVSVVRRNISVTIEVEYFTMNSGYPRDLYAPFSPRFVYQNDTYF